jgi:hypothetical protein
MEDENRGSGIIVQSLDDLPPVSQDILSSVALVRQWRWGQLQAWAMERWQPGDNCLIG